MGYKNKICRNDPCPCGSGKKYKKCCYPDKTREWKTADSHESPEFAVSPKEIPEPITHHFVSSDGGKTWKPRPGLLAAQICVKEPENIDEEIDKMTRSLSSDIRTLDLSQDAKQDLTKRISDMEHKLHAVKYHLKNYEKAEIDKVKEFVQSSKPPTGIQMMVEEPRLIYEVEAFLFQVKSCLDVLSRVLEPNFAFSHCKFGGEGDAIIRRLKNNCPVTLTNYAEKIIKLVEDAQDAWIVELITMRDKVTHHSRLEGFNCFVEDPYIGGSTASIHYPTMPNTKRVLEYCQDIWKRLLSFCEDFIRFTFEALATSSNL